jgi:predicted DNA-binding WGR domain protein
VPTLYVYPEYVWVERAAGGRWDRLNPLLCVAMERVSAIHRIPVLLYRYPTYYDPKHPDSPPPRGTGKGHIKGRDGMPDAACDEIREMFEFARFVLNAVQSAGKAALGNLANHPLVTRRQQLMAGMVPQDVRNCVAGQSDTRRPSPLSSCTVVQTEKLLRFVREMSGIGESHDFGLLGSREETVIYHPDANPRSDPYAGALAAVDYVWCRTGRTYEDRHMNLAIAWGRVSEDGDTLRVVRPSDQIAQKRSVKSFTERVRNLYRDQSKVLLAKRYQDLAPEEIPRYFMQLRFGTTFTKEKLVRMLAYLCDAVLFWDGVLWREG